MPRRRDALFPRIFLSAEVANTMLGLLVAKLYLDTPQKYGYPIFAAYYFLMAYEFFWYMKANWRAAWYGEDVVEEDVVEEQHDDAEEIEVAKVIPRPRLIEYPPPVDSEDEVGNETDDDDSDCVIVELPDIWDDSDNDEYHEASEDVKRF